MMMSQNSVIFFVLSYMRFTFFPVPSNFSDHHHSELTNVSDYLYFFSWSVPFQHFLNSSSSLNCCTAIALGLFFTGFPIFHPHLTLIPFPKSYDFLFLDPIPFFDGTQTLVTS